MFIWVTRGTKIINPCCGATEHVGGAPPDTALERRQERPCSLFDARRLVPLPGRAQGRLFVAYDAGRLRRAAAPDERAVFAL